MTTIPKGDRVRFGGGVAAALATVPEISDRVLDLVRLLEMEDDLCAIGVSTKWREVLGRAARVAPASSTVLLTGDSGTGKEVVARLIHRGSRRTAGPFVGINCAALPDGLLESELFGHERGAFTGAWTARAGRIEQAAGGTLFLDEIGEMSLPVQAKLLRVLEAREFQRLGGSRTQKADLRVIAATNRNLGDAMASGLFREDLFYRLHVFEIAIPPLRERHEDILPLAEHFIERLAPGIPGCNDVGLTAGARQKIRAHVWPGNVRELRNVIERALILCDGGPIDVAHLPEGLGAGVRALRPVRPTGGMPETASELEDIERRTIERTLEQTGQNKAKAARLLGVTRKKLCTRIQRLGLDAPEGLFA
jgi:DNA-binding NtrC family response regulator